VVIYFLQLFVLWSTLWRK